MNRHLSLRSGNPALKKNTFQNLAYSETDRMTLEGTVNKTIISLLILLFTASYTYSNGNLSYVLMALLQDLF